MPGPVGRRGPLRGRGLSLLSEVESRHVFSAEERDDLTLILVGSLFETKTAALSLSE